jgi:hypothetical protein
VFIRSEAGKAGTATITASHPTLGKASVALKVIPERGKYL